MLRRQEQKTERIRLAKIHGRSDVRTALRRIFIARRITIFFAASPNKPEAATISRKMFPGCPRRSLTPKPALRRGS